MAPSADGENNIQTNKGKKVKSNRTTKIMAACGFACILSLAANAQIGSGWTSVSESFKVQTSGSGKVSGNTFSISSTSSSTKDRAEREYATWSSGQHQFQGDFTCVSFGGTDICIKQTFQKNDGPWQMLAVNKGNTFNPGGGSFTIGKSTRINTILDCSKHTVALYINGKLIETYTGGKNPIYDKCGTYREDAGKAPITATWTNVKFWQK